jgi:hypothetical protein
MSACKKSAYALFSMALAVGCLLAVFARASGSARQASSLAAGTGYGIGCSLSVRLGGETYLIAVDLGNGQPVAVGHVDESNPQAVRRFLEPLVQRLGVRVIVTDDLVSFRKVADNL